METVPLPPLEPLLLPSLLPVEPVPLPPLMRHLTSAEAILEQPVWPVPESLELPHWTSASVTSPEAMAIAAMLERPLSAKS